MTDEGDRSVAYRRLERRREQRVLGGVAGGLADHFGLDPLLFRVGFVALALFGGSGLLLYVLGWLFVPEKGAPGSAAAGLTRDIGIRKLAALVLIGIALLVLAGPIWMPLTQAGYLDSSLAWAFVLVVIGFALLRGERPKPSPDGGDALAPSADASTARATEVITPPPSASAVQASWRPPVPPAAAQPRPRRSPLGWIAVAVALLVVGVGALLDRSPTLVVDAGTMLAQALVVLGVGLVVGAFWGRARWLVLVGMVLLPAALVGNLIDFPLTGQVGGNYLSPRRASDLSDGYDVLAGSLTLDMTDFDFNAGESITLPLHMAVAGVTISVPRGVGVSLRGHVEAGQVNFFGSRREGVDLELDESAGQPELDRRLLVDLDAQYGSVNLYRSGLVKDLRAQRRAERRAAERADAAAGQKKRDEKNQQKGEQ